MKREKAIEILTHMTKYRNVSFLEDCTTAIKLGIEALKRVQDMRISPCTTADEILPGETKD